MADKINLKDNSQSVAAKSQPRWRRLLTPICFFTGHPETPAPDKPGWFLITCQRCGRDTNHTFFRRTRNIPYRIETGLVRIANWMHKARKDYPGKYNPKYRAIDQQIIGIGTEHSCAAYSYEHITSYIKQREDDGLPPALLSDLISEEGWINLEEHPEEIQPMLDQLSKGVELLRTKQEQEELNRYED